MSEPRKKSNSNTETIAELYLALDDLTMALATCDDENVRKSEVFQKALEVVKIVKKMRKLQIKPDEEEKS